MPLYRLDGRKVEAILERLGAILRGDHFVYYGGEHGPDYVEKYRITRNPAACYELASQIALYFRTAELDAIVTPAYGAIPLGDYVALQLSWSSFDKKPVPNIIAQRDAHGEFRIPVHSRELIAEKRVLVVEDTINTGITTGKAVLEALKCGGKVVAVASIVNRGGGVTPVDLGLGEHGEIYSLLHLNLPRYSADRCPLCKAGVPVNTQFGHGREFLERAKA